MQKQAGASGPVALLVAAGSGERLGAAVPKAFVEVAGRPLIEWSLDALRAAGIFSEIVVALPLDAVAPSGCVGVRGGATRSESVLAALLAAPGSGPVVVHDAARPLVEPSLFVRVLDALETADCAIAAARMTDTIKEADDALGVVATLDRSRLWAIQTPQTFPPLGPGGGARCRRRDPRSCHGRRLAGRARGRDGARRRVPAGHRRSRRRTTCGWPT